MGYAFGMIHGRFQPFHLEHLGYFRLGWERSERVIVGITNPDPSTIVQDQLNEHRDMCSSNPFTFTERLIMIQETLWEEGYLLDRIFIVPLPIHHPDRWPHYVPPRHLHIRRGLFSLGGSKSAKISTGWFQCNSGGLSQ